MEETKIKSELTDLVLIKDALNIIKEIKQGLTTHIK